MKPVKLEFEGINSFSEHTIIDFEPLTKSGIFGIFGDTGSGKSTILDCINFALYGRVERSKEKTDIINYRCTQARVDFTFNILSGGKRRTYLVERTIKKDKSGTHKAFLYEDGECIADKPQEVERKILEVLGLEAEDFRKCIALPQGEFSQFVKSAPRERLQLIERLFSLSKYGDRLKEKIAAKQSEAESEYQNLTGKLSAYEDISAEILTTAEEQFSAGKRRLSGIEKSAKQAEDSYRKANALFEKRMELDSAHERLENLKNNAQKMEELRRELSLLPVCREAVRLEAEINENSDRINTCAASIKSINDSLKESAAKIARLEEQFKEGNFAGRIDELLKLTARYSDSTGKPEKLKLTLKRLEDLRSEYKLAEAKRAELLKGREETEKSLAELEKSGEKLGLTDLENFVNIRFKGAILRGEYVSQLDYFADLHAKLEQYCDDSELYAFIDGEIKSRVEEFKQRILAVKDFSLEKVNEQFALLENAQKDKEELDRKKLELTRKLGDFDTRLKERDGALEAIKKDGVELKNRADELREELNAIFGRDCADYSGAARAAEQQLSSLRAESKKLTEIIEAEKNSASATRETLAVETTNRTNLNAERERLLEKLNAAVASSGLKDLAECRAIAGRFEEYPDAEKTLSEFDSSLAALRHKIAEFQAVEGIDGVTRESVEGLKAESERLGEEKSTLDRELAVLSDNLTKSKKRLDEKLQLLKEFAGVEKRKKLIDQLKEITKNNKFLEFIANEYLYDISTLASSTLLKLTDGRYFLTYKDNFSVGDNFNCGETRGVNTLSGGETFLVSLSLALALSQTICSKSLRSIEFFFLDEGFGTLDTTLVDTVMSALEKLKSSAFTIGVISHVEELKHRIDSKITVIKATENRGSTVQISC